MCPSPSVCPSSSAQAGQPLTSQSSSSPAQPKFQTQPRSGLSHVSETGLETGLKLRQLLSLSDVPQPPSPAALTSCSCLAPSHPAGPAPSAQSETGLKVCQPGPPAGVSYVSATGLRPSPASQPQAQVCMRQALPIQRPAQAQLSPARPAEVPGATNSVVRLPSRR